MIDIFKNKRILLTGGTGSFGNEFTKILLDKYNPKSIRIFSRDEKKQLDMKNKFNDDRLRFFIGNVRDKNRLHRSMSAIDIVVHAAALKQVPSCEYNPIEAIKTNINGSINIIDTAIDNKIDRVIFISTDKAVHPVNLYGATKMTAEKLFIQGNSYSGEVRTKFSCIRYGNVIGSRGSVIPLFLKQKKNREITITDSRMIRFWITIEQGIKYVISCIEKMQGGEIFIPKIPSMKIIDIAKAIAPNAEIKTIGIRPGEKIYETLLTEDEARHSLEVDDGFIIMPENPSWYIKLKGKKLPNDFKYTSINNNKYLTKKDINKIIKELECPKN